MRRLLALSSALMIAACTVGPDYQTPDLAQDPAFHRPIEQPLSTGEVMERWWVTLGEPELLALVNQALEVNNTVEIARANLQVARATYAEPARVRQPVGSAAGNATRQRQGQVFPGGSVDANEVYRLSIDTTWELDFFGRVRSATAAAAAEVEAAEASLEDAQVAVAAEVGLAFAEMRGTQRRLEVARRLRYPSTSPSALRASCGEDGPTSAPPSDSWRPPPIVSALPRRNSTRASTCWAAWVVKRSPSGICRTAIPVAIASARRSAGRCLTLPGFAHASAPRMDGPWQP